MNGIEKITGQIDADARGEIERLSAQAKTEVEEILTQAAEKAQAEGDEILRRGKESAAAREERLAGVAELEGRKTILAAKQDMVAKAFDAALERLCTLPDEEYVDLLANLAVKAARTGREQVIFAPKDRNRVGKAAVTRANELLAKRVAPKLPDELGETKTGAFLDKLVTNASALLAGTGMLTLAEGTRPIKGGLILTDGEVETNCSFEALIRARREELSGAVAKALFD